jgi:serine protease Do
VRTFLHLGRIVFFALLMAHYAPNAAQGGEGSDKKSKLAVDRTLAIYVPQHESEELVFIPRMNASFTPGKALEDAAVRTGNAYFKSARLFDVKSDAPFDLVLVTHSHWETKDELSILRIKYKLIDAAGTTLFEGEKKDDIKTRKLLFENSFFSLSSGVMKDILSDEDLLSKAAGSTHAGNVSASTFDPKLLVDREKAATTGTGFFINDHGQIMTAAHVVHDCPVTEVKSEGKAVDARSAAESVLLDLAVLDTGSASAHVIPLRVGTGFDLGEGVIDVGFPLNGVLASSPNVTRGNISSREALAGAAGQFQFSAPVQPGSSGGPVVSETGELLGVTVGSLGVAGLMQRGILPQNVNFALDARYAASFMDRYKIRYVSVQRGRAPDAHAATETTLPAVVQVSCYQ